jgi:pyruvate/2-oxoglutarate dehydrogenase complex dihydrolipoamide dehydrogenase (E3) component
MLGDTILAPHAGDMINEITLAMVAGIGLRKLSRVRAIRMETPLSTPRANMEQAALSSVP